eukprot:5886215-Prymnesium_polylepis.1
MTVHKQSSDGRDEAAAQQAKIQQVLRGVRFGRVDEVGDDRGRNRLPSVAEDALDAVASPDGRSRHPHRASEQAVGVLLDETKGHSSPRHAKPRVEFAAMKRSEAAQRTERRN